MRAGYGCVRVLIAIVIIALSPLSVGPSAQTYQGGLRGLVKDAQGVIPGVEVATVFFVPPPIRDVHFCQRIASMS